MTSIFDGLPIVRRRRRWGRDFEGTARLDVVEVVEGSFPTNGFVAEVSILGGVNG